MNRTTKQGPLARKVAKLREEAGLSLYQLGNMSGINRSKLMRIENGEIRTPTIETLNKIATALGADLEDIYDAAWAEHTGPLPSLATYFRRKYRFSPEQIARVERYVHRMTQEPPTATAIPRRQQRKEGP